MIKRELGDGVKTFESVRHGIIIEYIIRERRTAVSYR